jgi:beta-N-acetylhexosaminidase
MPAHVVYAKVDRRPAGFSQHWLGQVLREQLGFDGAVFSDDLSMQAARRVDGQQLSDTQAAVAALSAGCDLALLCNQSVAAGQGGPGVLAPLDAFVQGMEQARMRGQWQPNAASERRRRALLPTAPAPSWSQLGAMANYRNARSLLGL